MRSKIVPISNIARLADAANALIHRTPGMPGMGLVEGHTGLGKTTAFAWLTIQHNGVFVRALAATTTRSLLDSICKELGVGRRATNVDTIEAIVQRLAETGRPLFIDEADYLLSKKMLIETLRDIHDLSTVPVILIGMHGFRRKVEHLQQLTGRIAQRVEFEPATADDAALLIKSLADVDVAADLVRKLHSDAHGSVRLMIVGLARIEQFARARNLARITLSDWPSNAEFFVGVAPGQKRGGNSPSLAAVS